MPSASYKFSPLVVSNSENEIRLLKRQS